MYTRLHSSFSIVSRSVEVWDYTVLVPHLFSEYMFCSQNNSINKTVLFLLTIYFYLCTHKSYGTTVVYSVYSSNGHETWTGFSLPEKSYNFPVGKLPISHTKFLVPHDARIVFMFINWKKNVYFYFSKKYLHLIKCTMIYVI